MLGGSLAANNARKPNPPSSTNCSQGSYRQDQFGPLAGYLHSPKSETARFHQRPILICRRIETPPFGSAFKQFFYSCRLSKLGHDARLNIKNVEAFPFKKGF